MAKVNKKKPLFICLTGIDGSGKTTQAHSLIQILRGQGIESIYVWNKFELWLTMPFIKIGKALFFQGKDIFENYGEYAKRRKRIFANPIIAAGYQYLLLLDCLLQTLFKIKIPLMRQKNIVCDRYIFDTVADLAADLNYSEKRAKRISRLFLSLAPKPDLTFLIDLPEGIAYERKSDIPSLDYLKERKGIYLSMGREYKMTILDGRKDAAELQYLIQEKVSEAISG